MKTILDVFNQKFLINGQNCNFFDVQKNPALIQAWYRKAALLCHPDKHPNEREHYEIIFKKLKSYTELIKNQQSELHKSIETYKHRYEATQTLGGNNYTKSLNYDFSVPILMPSQQTKEMFRDLYNLSTEELELLDKQFKTYYLELLKKTLDSRLVSRELGTRLLALEGYLNNQSVISEFHMLSSNHSIRENIEALSQPNIRYYHFDTDCHNHAVQWLAWLNEFINDQEVQHNFSKIYFHLVEEHRLQSNWKIFKSYLAKAFIIALQLPLTLFAWTTLTGVFLFLTSPTIFFPETSLLVLLGVVFGFVGLLFLLEYSFGERRSQFTNFIAESVIQPYLNCVTSIAETIFDVRFFSLSFAAHLYAINKNNKPSDSGLATHAFFQPASESQQQAHHPLLLTN